MTFPHEESSESHDHPDDMAEESAHPSWWRPVAVPLVSALVAFAIGVVVAVWIVDERSDRPTETVDETSTPISPEKGDTDVGVVDTDDARSVAWEKEIYPTPSCPSILQNLVNPSAEYGAWSKCESYAFGSLKTGDYAGWLLSRYVMTTENEMGGPTEISFLMLIEPSDVPRMVRLLGTAEGRTALFNPITYKAPEDEMGLFGMIEPALLMARVSMAEMSFPELDRFAGDRVMTSSNPLDGTRVTLRSLGTAGSGNMELNGDATRYFSAHALGIFEDGTLVAPALDQRLAGAFIALRPDGRLEYYDALAPLFHPDEQYGYLGVQGSVDVRWDDGSAPGLYFKSARTGCGISAPIDLVARAGLLPLHRTGTTLTGDAVYEHETLPDSYTWMHEAWAYQQPEGADTSVTAFLSLHPFFFWEDELGRLLRFTRSDVIPMAECGKPVVYLYPETTMEISVKLAPEGGFSKTEPAYNDGWNVTAFPDGRLVNKTDGLTYPYLFWEGTGGLYQAPTEFDVVARAEVESYLRTTLATLGLNKTESADFMMFWLPRMQSASYYKIGWHGRSVMDALAPMSLSVRPDRVIRILMDFEELDAPIASNSATFHTPTREGFTVVEWGGVLR